MTINPADVARAYSNMSKSGGMGDGAGSINDATGPSFGEFLKDQINEVVETGNNSEKTAISAMAGKAELVDVVTAISAAEVTLETVVAVRDKVIGAYNEIMRMPI